MGCTKTTYGFYKPFQGCAKSLGDSWGTPGSPINMLTSLNAFLGGWGKLSVISYSGQK